MNKIINPFILLIDKEGDVATTIAANSPIDYILDMVRIYDRERQEDAPHVAFRWSDGYFNEVVDIKVPSSKLLKSKPIKRRSKK